MSKRSKSSSNIAKPSLATPKSKAARAENASSPSKVHSEVFAKVFAAAGLDLQQGAGGEGWYYATEKLNVPQVRSTVLKGARHLSEQKHRMDAFLAWLEEMDDDQFRALLSPYRIASKENDGEFSSPQDSIFRYCLQEPQLQSVAVQGLKEWIVVKDDREFTRLALQNLRYLSIADSEAVAGFLMEAVQECGNQAVQRDLIEAIPEIIDDVGHKITVEGLQNLISDVSFTGVILDTYSCLNMSTVLLSEIHKDLLTRLHSLGDEFLPTAVKFLLQTTPVKQLSGVVNHVRDDLQLFPLSVLNKRSEALDYHRMTLETMRTAMSFDERIAVAFLNAVSSAKDCLKFDLWMLYIIHGLSDKLRAKVETIFRKKAAAGAIDKAVFMQSLKLMTEVLSPYYPAILSLAERSVRSTDTALSDLGIHMYSMAFAGFVSLMHRQDLITKILEHVGAQSEIECTAGLEVLLKLAQSEKHTALKDLWMFVETVLDHLDSFSKSNARKAWKMFSCLIWSGNKGDPLDQKIYDMLQLVLRKQVSNMRDVYRRSGIIGSAAILGAMSTHRQDVDFRLIEKEFDAIMSMFETLPDARYKALAFDELACVFQDPHVDFDPNVIEKTTLSAYHWFEEFVVECSPQADVINDAEVMYNLLGNETNVVLDIWRDADRPAADNKLTFLFSLVRMLQMLQRRMPNGLLDMGVFVAGPLLIYPPNAMEEFEDYLPAKQHRIIQSIFYAINWMRELLNTFGDIELEQTRLYLLSRLTHMHELEEQLEKCLRICPSSVPCLRDPTSALCATKVGSASEPSKKKAKAAGGKRKKKNAEGEDAVQGSSGDDLNQSVDLPRVRSLTPNFRAFDLSVASILSFPSTAAPQNACCTLRPFALHTVVQVLDQYSSMLFEEKKQGPFARKAKDVDFPVWMNHDYAMTKVIQPMMLGEHLLRLGTYVASWQNSEGASWLEEDEMEFDHDATAHDSEERSKHEFYWYIVPAQRMAYNVYRRLFTWLHRDALTGSEEHAIMVDQIMRSILVRLSCSSGKAGCGNDGSGGSLGDVKGEVWKQVSSLSESVQSVASAVSYIEMLDALANYGVGRKFAQPSMPGSPDNSGSVSASSENPSMYTEIANLSLGYLQKAWSPESGGMHAADVRPLLQKYLQRTKFRRAAEPIVLALKSKCDGVPDDAELPLEKFATLTKSTMSVYFKTCFIELNRSLKALALEKHTVTNERNKARLVRAFDKLTGVFANLIRCIRGEKATKQIMASVLREGRVFCEIVLRGMPFFGSLATSDPKSVQKLQPVESGARILSRLCDQAKEEGERLLIPLIPPVKKVLEKFIMETCRLVNSAGLSGAFKMGILQNKTLDGKILSSQVSYHAADANQGEAEDDPDDDDAPDDDDEGGKAPVAPALGKSKVKKERADAEDDEEDEDDEDDVEDEQDHDDDIQDEDDEDENVRGNKLIMETIPDSDSSE